MPIKGNYVCTNPRDQNRKLRMLGIVSVKTGKAYKSIYTARTSLPRASLQAAAVIEYFGQKTRGRARFMRAYTWWVGPKAATYVWSRRLEVRGLPLVCLRAYLFFSFLFFDFPSRLAVHLVRLQRPQIFSA